MENLLTAEQISKATGLHLLTIYARARRGEIPGIVRLGRRTLRFRESVITEWLDSKTNEFTQEEPEEPTRPDAA